MRVLVTLVAMTVVLSACAESTVRTRRAEGTPPRRERPPDELARARPPEPPAPPRAPAATRADDGPLTAKIDATTPASRSAALRLTEEGRHRLDAGDPARAIELLERAITVDSRVPYTYYFLARAHAEAGHADLAQRFLDRAAQKLAKEPYWMSEVHRVRGTLLSAEGKHAEADASYRRALDAWPGNRAAAEALTADGRRGKEAP